MSDITINIKGPSELKLEITINPEKTVLELKQAIAEKSDVEADRQRLIFSGRVLKDEDTLTTYKIAATHTIHMVKGAVRSAAAASSTPQALPTMQSGQAANDPLTLLNGHRGFGAMAGVNPFAQAGLNPNDPNMMQTMMNSPEFLQQMAAVMSDPNAVEQMIAMDPNLRAMGPQVREMFASPQFRQMLSNPQQMQQMIQMAQSMRGGGEGGGMGGMGDMGGMGNMFGGGGAGGFPAPGVPGVPNAAAPPPQPNAAAPNAFGGAFNPFAALGGAGGGAGGFGGAPADPWGTNGWAAPAAPAAPADTRSPEERFETQLQQLNGMGFSNASQNVRALLATSGNVHAAIEYILGGGGI